MKHELKCLPKFFQAAWVGDKTFEIRKNDREFAERDEIVLQEFNQGKSDEDEYYSDREIDGVITYLTDFKQKPGYVVFGFRITGQRE